MVSEKHMPFCAKHVRVWESEIGRLRFESDFCFLWLIIQFCLPVSQISCIHRSLHKNICHVLPSIWECEKVRLFDWDLRVIFVWPFLMLWVLFQVYQTYLLYKSFQKYIVPNCHFVPNMWECENVRLCVWVLRLRILVKEWIFFPVSQRSDYAFKYLKWSVLTYAFRKKGNIFTKLVWVWECESVLHSNLIQK